jgi:hypothetical protein
MRVNLSPDEYNALEIVAKRECRSMASFIRSAVLTALERSAAIYDVEQRAELDALKLLMRTRQRERGTAPTPKPKRKGSKTTAVQGARA